MYIKYTHCLFTYSMTPFRNVSSPITCCNIRNRADPTNYVIKIMNIKYV